MPYLVRTPSIIKPLGRDFLWNFKRDEPVLYLTFDDGPTPGVTEKVLTILESYNAKATFFCLGKNVAAHPNLYRQIIDKGHAIGNHSFSHADGWRTCTFSYVRDVMQAARLIESNLFRPPYGRITMSESSVLKKKFRIVMWDVISGDFDQSITPAQCGRNVINNTKAGSIVVFHDSEKASLNCIPALETSLRFFSERGFGFAGIGQKVET